MRIINATELANDFFTVDYTVDYNDEELQEKREKNLAIVKTILDNVRKEGDRAVQRYTRQFDNIVIDKKTAPGFEVSAKEITAAYKKIDPKTLDALKKAAARITLFAKAQWEQQKTGKNLGIFGNFDFGNFEIQDNGIILGQKIIPLTRVGCYVPGGRYPLPSSALMSIIPAKVAGVKEVIVCSPKIAPVTIVAANLAGADRIFAIGGAQAIGAMAYGTASVPQVDKIVGPGNTWVTMAKKEVYGIVGIDGVAGPSELLIIADEAGNPAWIAADLLAQAEHDPEARVDLITTSRALALRVTEQINRQLGMLKTKDIATIALRKGNIVIVASIEEAIILANKRAPEHLELQVKNSEQYVKKLENYGSLFIGENSAEVFGDYCSGTNHILPTNGTARYRGGLSVYDFVKILTYQKIDKKVPKELIAVAAQLAEVEGLDGHKKSALSRLQ